MKKKSCELILKYIIIKVLPNCDTCIYSTTCI